MKTKKMSDDTNEDKVIIAEAAHKNKSKVHHLMLVLGAWKKLFTLSIRNILIAKALNHTVRKNGLIIYGYLITESRIYLVVKCKKHTMEDTLEKFAKRLNKEIKSYLKYSLAPCKSLKKRKKHGHKKDNRAQLFRECILWNENLIKLLTGQKVDLLYYSPAVAKLADMIDNYNYCSALDYTGAEGPVIVKIMKNHSKIKLSN